jgi:hypothetical protein
MTYPTPPVGEIVLYQTDDGRTRVECRFADESLWLSQALMAELFQTSPQNITLHLKALYEEGEIEESATCKEYLLVRREGGGETSAERSSTTTSMPSWPWAIASGPIVAPSSVVGPPSACANTW